MTAPHIMVDLETWGTTPGCDIRSIGAVVFDPIAGTLGEEFYVNVIGGFEMYGLLLDPSTVKWWSEQSDAARLRLVTDQVCINPALHRFAEWWRGIEWSHRDEDGPDIARFWAHGPHFDEAILAACYRAVGISVPWHYRAPRDCRTIFDAAGDPCHVPFEGVEHDALADAKNQALRVIEAYRRLRAPIEALKQIEEHDDLDLSVSDLLQHDRNSGWAAAMRQCGEIARTVISKEIVG
jgi:hypothetical protein